MNGSGQSGVGGERGRERGCRFRNFRTVCFCKKKEMIGSRLKSKSGFFHPVYRENKKLKKTQ